MLGSFWRRRVELFEGVGNAARHGEVGSMIDVIPLKSNATVNAASPVRCDSVEIVEAVNKMLCILLAHILDTKVADNKCEGDGLSALNSVMQIETRSALNRAVAIFGEVHHKMIIGEDTSVREAIHALANFDENVAVVDEWRKVVVIHDYQRDVFNGDLHVLITRHQRAQVEALDVDGHELGMLGGEDAVGVNLDGG